MYYILQPIGDEFKTRFSIFRDDCMQLCEVKHGKYTQGSNKWRDVDYRANNYNPPVCEKFVAHDPVQ